MKAQLQKKSCKTPMCRVLSGKVHFMVFSNNQHKVLSDKQLLQEEEGPQEGLSFSKFA